MLAASDHAGYTPGQRTSASPKTEQIEAMLLRLRDAMTVESGAPPTGTLDSRLLLFSPAFNAAFRELDRCLAQLKNADGALHWHVRAWYVDCGWRQEEHHRWEVIGGKRRKIPAGFVMAAQRHRDADLKHAESGVRWLATVYRFDRVHLKDLLEATGYAH